MIVVERPSGTVVVTQTEHAAMCRQLGCAWGNPAFGPVERADEVWLAAAEHERGWADWERAPTLDRATGLPHTPLTLDLATHLPMQLEGPRRVAEQSPYAGLVCSMKHTSMYRSPSRIAALRPDRRRLRAFLAQSTAFQADLRARLRVDDAQLDRDWRLVRTWDGLSHDLLLDRSPCVRAGAPAAGTARVDLHIEWRDGSLTIEPWPFALPRITVSARGRLLDERFREEERMRAALAAAPEVTLVYELCSPVAAGGTDAPRGRRPVRT